MSPTEQVYGLVIVSVGQRKTTSWRLVEVTIFNGKTGKYVHTGAFGCLPDSDAKDSGSQHNGGVYTTLCIRSLVTVSRVRCRSVQFGMWCSNLCCYPTLHYTAQNM